MAFDPRTKEERKLFPFWTLIVIAGCAALWVFSAKIYQEMRHKIPIIRAYSWMESIWAV